MHKPSNTKKNGRNYKKNGNKGSCFPNAFMSGSIDLDCDAVPAKSLKAFGPLAVPVPIWGNRNAAFG